MSPGFFLSHINYNDAKMQIIGFSIFFAHKNHRATIDALDAPGSRTTQLRAGRDGKMGEKSREESFKRNHSSYL